MKFLKAFAGFFAVTAAAGEHKNDLETLVNSALEAVPIVFNATMGTVEAIGKYMPDIPRRARDAPGLYDENGEVFQKVMTRDAERRYDEATFKVYHRALRMGHKIPKTSKDGQDDCMDTPMFGLMLGFAYGLQYNPKEKGQCFGSIETSIEAANNLV